MDKSGNYVNTDGSEPDNGYGSHRVPGGKVKNPGAHAKLLKREEDQTTENQPTASAPLATDGFSFRNDPGFIEHQTNFEAQQQKILEDAWASLVENEDQADNNEVAQAEEEVPASKSADDEYAAALAISPSMFGLNFDTNDNIDSVMLPPAVQATATSSAEEPIDLAQFALGAASSASGAAQPANPFSSPLGGLWGAGTSGGASASTSLGALSGWDATPFGAETDTTTAGQMNGSSAQSSKLHLWGSSAADTLGGDLGALGNSEDATKGTD